MSLMMMASLAPSKRSWLTQGASIDPQFVLPSLIQQTGPADLHLYGRGLEDKIAKKVFQTRRKSASAAKAVTMAAPFKVYLKSNVNTYLMLLVWPDQTVRDMAGERMAV